MSYLISNGKLVAYTSEQLKSGELVRVAYNITQDSIYEFNYLLVNARMAKVSNAKKWDSSPAMKYGELQLACLVNDNAGTYKDYYIGHGEVL